MLVARRISEILGQCSMTSRLGSCTSLVNGLALLEHNSMAAPSETVDLKAKIAAA